MPSGFIQLITNNTENNISNNAIYNNPEITFFKDVFRRHTNFYIENNVTVNKNNNDNDFKIEKLGDLVYNPILKVNIDEREIELGKDFQNYYNTNTISNYINNENIQNNDIIQITSTDGLITAPNFNPLVTNIDANNGKFGLLTKANNIIMLGYDNNPTLIHIPEIIWNQIQIFSIGENVIVTLLLDGTLYAWGNIDTNNFTPILPYVMVRAGYNHYFAIDSANKLYSCGSNTYIASPPQTNDIIAVETSLNNALAIDTDGNLIVWGKNNKIITDAPTLNNVKLIKIRDKVAMAVTTDNIIYVWGESEFNVFDVPDEIQGHLIKNIACCNSHVIIQTESDTIYGWGSNLYGESKLDNLSTDQFSLQGHIINIAVGTHYTILLMDINKVVIIGNTFDANIIPVDYAYDNRYALTDEIVENIGQTSRAIQVSALGYSACALLDDGRILPWGLLRNNPSIRKIKNTGITKISCGERFMLYLVNNKVFVIDDFSILPETPVDVLNNNIKDIACGVKHAIVLLEDGTIRIWGRNLEDYGLQNIPMGVYEKINSGYFHAMAIDVDGYITSWGRNIENQVSSTPSYIQSRTVCAGYYSSVAIDIYNNFYGWGFNGGLGPFYELQLPYYYPYFFTPLSGQFVKIVHGWNYCIILNDSGQIQLWGNFYAFNKYYIPPYLNQGTIIDITGGKTNAIALTNTNKVICWGTNVYGESSPPAEINFVNYSFLTQLTEQKENNIIHTEEITPFNKNKTVHTHTNFTFESLLDDYEIKRIQIKWNGSIITNYNVTNDIKNILIDYEQNTLLVIHSFNDEQSYCEIEFTSNNYGDYSDFFNATFDYSIYNTLYVNTDTNVLIRIDKNIFMFEDFFTCITDNIEVYHFTINIYTNTIVIYDNNNLLTLILSDKINTYAIVKNRTYYDKTNYNEITITGNSFTTVYTVNTHKSLLHYIIFSTNKLFVRSYYFDKNEYYGNLNKDICYELIQSNFNIVKYSVSNNLIYYIRMLVYLFGKNTSKFLNINNSDNYFRKEYNSNYTLFLEELLNFLIENNMNLEQKEINGLLNVLELYKYYTVYNPNDYRARPLINRKIYDYDTELYLLNYFKKLINYDNSYDDKKILKNLIYNNKMLSNNQGETTFIYNYTNNMNNNYLFQNDENIKVEDINIYFILNVYLYEIIFDSYRRISNVTFNIDNYLLTVNEFIQNPISATQYGILPISSYYYVDNIVSFTMENDNNLVNIANKMKYFYTVAYNTINKSIVNTPIDDQVFVNYVNNSIIKTYFNEFYEKISYTLRAVDYNLINNTAKYISSVNYTSSVAYASDPLLFPQFWGTYNQWFTLIYTQILQKIYLIYPPPAVSDPILIYYIFAMPIYRMLYFHIFIDILVFHSSLSSVVNYNLFTDLITTTQAILDFVIRVVSFRLRFDVIPVDIVLPKTSTNVQFMNNVYIDGEAMEGLQNLFDLDPNINYGRGINLDDRYISEFIKYIMQFITPSNQEFIYELLNLFFNKTTFNYDRIQFLVNKIINAQSTLSTPPTVIYQDTNYDIIDIPYLREIAESIFVMGVLYDNVNKINNDTINKVFNINEIESTLIYNDKNLLSSENVISILNYTKTLLSNTLLIDDTLLSKTYDLIYYFKEMVYREIPKLNKYYIVSEDYSIIFNYFKNLVDQWNIVNNFNYELLLKNNNIISGLFYHLYVIFRDLLYTDIKNYYDSSTNITFIEYLYKKYKENIYESLINNFINTIQNVVIYYDFKTYQTQQIYTDVITKFDNIKYKYINASQYFDKPGVILVKNTQDIINDNNEINDKLRKIYFTQIAQINSDKKFKLLNILNQFYTIIEQYSNVQTLCNYFDNYLNLVIVKSMFVEREINRFLFYKIISSNIQYNQVNLFDVKLSDNTYYLLHNINIFEILNYNYYNDEKNISYSPTNLFNIIDYSDAWSQFNIFVTLYNLPTNIITNNIEFNNLFDQFINNQAAFSPYKIFNNIIFGNNLDFTTFYLQINNVLLRQKILFYVFFLYYINYRIKNYLADNLLSLVKNNITIYTKYGNIEIKDSNPITNYVTTQEVNDLIDAIYSTTPLNNNDIYSVISNNILYFNTNSYSDLFNTYLECCSSLTFVFGNYITLINYSYDDNSYALYNNIYSYLINNSNLTIFQNNFYNVNILLGYVHMWLKFYGVTYDDHDYDVENIIFSCLQLSYHHNKYLDKIKGYTDINSIYSNFKEITEELLGKNNMLSYMESMKNTNYILPFDFDDIITFVNTQQLYYYDTSNIDDIKIDFGTKYYYSSDFVYYNFIDNDKYINKYKLFYYNNLVTNANIWRYLYKHDNDLFYSLYYDYMVTLLQNNYIHKTDYSQSFITVLKIYADISFSYDNLVILTNNTIDDNIHLMNNLTNYNKTFNNLQNMDDIILFFIEYYDDQVNGMKDLLHIISNPNNYYSRYTFFNQNMVDKLFFMLSQLYPEKVFTQQDKEDYLNYIINPTMIQYYNINVFLTFTAQLYEIGLSNFNLQINSTIENQFYIDMANYVTFYIGYSTDQNYNPDNITTKTYYDSITSQPIVIESSMFIQFMYSYIQFQIEIFHNYAQSNFMTSPVLVFNTIKQMYFWSFTNMNNTDGNVEKNNILEFQLKIIHAYYNPNITESKHKQLVILYKIILFYFYSKMDNNWIDVIFKDFNYQLIDNQFYYIMNIKNDLLIKLDYTVNNLKYISNYYKTIMYQTNFSMGSSSQNTYIQPIINAVIQKYNYSDETTISQLLLVNMLLNMIKQSDDIIIIDYILSDQVTLLQTFIELINTNIIHNIHKVDRIIGGKMEQVFNISANLTTIYKAYANNQLKFGKDLITINSLVFNEFNKNTFNPNKYILLLYNIMLLQYALSDNFFLRNNIKDLLVQLSILVYTKEQHVMATIDTILTTNFNISHHVISHTNNINTELITIVNSLFNNLPQVVKFKINEYSANHKNNISEIYRFANLLNIFIEPSTSEIIKIIKSIDPFDTQNKDFIQLFLNYYDQKNDNNIMSDNIIKLVNKIDLYINNDVIDTIYPENLDISYKHFMDLNKKYGVDQMLGFNDNNITFVNPFIITKKKQTYHIPLEFFFHNHHNAIPLIACMYSDIHIKVKLNDVDALYNNYFITTLINKPNVNSEILMDYIYVEREERHEICSKVRDTLIPIKGKYEKVVITNYLDRHTFEFNIHSIIKQIFIKIEILINDIPLLIPDVENYSDIFDLISYIDVELDNIKRDRIQNNLLNHYKYNTQARQSNYYMYSFALDPQDYQPSGQLCGSNYNSMSFIVKFNDEKVKAYNQDNLMNQQKITVKMTLFTYEYNMMRYYAGMTGVFFT